MNKPRKDEIWEAFGPTESGSFNDFIPVRILTGRVCKNGTLWVQRVFVARAGHWLALGEKWQLSTKDLCGVISEA